MRISYTFSLIVKRTFPLVGTYKQRVNDESNRHNYVSVTFRNLLVNGERYPSQVEAVVAVLCAVPAVAQQVGARRADQDLGA